MKRTLLFILFILAIIVIVLAGIILNRRFEENEAKKPNMEFEYILKKEMYGADVATIINKSLNNNEKYKIEKNSEGKYKDDNAYCIQVEISFLEVEETYSMEQIYKAGIEEFMQAFNISKFKCEKIEYHKSTGRISKISLKEIE